MPLYSRCSAARSSCQIIVFFLFRCSQHKPHCAEHSLFSFLRHPTPTNTLCLPLNSIPHLASTPTTHTTTASRPANSTQLKSNLSKKHASHLRHVLNQQHPRHFGPCSFHHHSPGAHGDGLASTIRQSRQQPTQRRWFKLPMQSHEQFWWHRHQHGYRRPADALLPGRICAWRWILSSLSYYRYTCNEEL